MFELPAATPDNATDQSKYADGIYAITNENHQSKCSKLPELTRTVSPKCGVYDNVLLLKR